MRGFSIFSRQALLLMLPVALWSAIGVLMNLGSEAMAATLSGEIRQDVWERQPQAVSQNGLSHGVVSDAETGAPVAGAVVTIPDLGLATRSRPDGSYYFPELSAGSEGGVGAVLSVQRDGYLPESRIVQTGRLARGEAFKIAIRKQARVVVIDTNLHHLGDNSFSPYSAGAGQFRQPARGARLIKQFTLGGQEPSVKPVLQIGTVLGLDTREAQSYGQSHLSFSSTPMRVWLNGHEISRIGVNGSRQNIPVPPEVLNLAGLNTLEIEAGYQTPRDRYTQQEYTDYDDLELMHLILML